MSDKVYFEHFLFVLFFSQYTRQVYWHSIWLKQGFYLCICLTNIKLYMSLDITYTLAAQIMNRNSP